MSGFHPDFPLPITHRHPSVLLEAQGPFSDFLPTTQTHTWGFNRCHTRVRRRFQHSSEPILVKHTSQSRQRPPSNFMESTSVVGPHRRDI